jgi:hypothetical protein
MPDRDQLQSVRSEIPQSSAACRDVSSSGVMPPPSPLGAMWATPLPVVVVRPPLPVGVVGADPWGVFAVLRTGHPLPRVGSWACLFLGACRMLLLGRLLGFSQPRRRAGQFAIGCFFVSRQWSLGHV